MQNGGYRPGAGRPKGGISQTRRLMASAIAKGLAHAGRTKYPDMVSPTDMEEAAADTAAMIVSDMIQAGQGNEVIKLWAQVAIKESDGQNSQSKNILADALSRLPSPSHVSDMSQSHNPEPQTPDNTGLDEGRPTDTKSIGALNLPFFAPQVPLDLDSQDDPEQTCDHSERALAGTRSLAQAHTPAPAHPSAPAGAHPHPRPPAHTQPYIGGHENF